MGVVRKKRIFTVFFILISCLAVEEVLSFASGAPPGFAGTYADGGSTCVTCHPGATPTPVNGWITSNIPVSGYIPGNTYTINAQALGTGHVRFGFEISPMDSFGAVMGTMTDITAETEVIGGGYYITHSFIGTSGSNSKMWTFDWTAPNPGVGSVIFYGAFNVADDNASNTMDTIFTSTYTVQEDLSIATNDVLYQNGFYVFPNPARDFLHVSFKEQKRNPIFFTLFDLNGKVVLKHDSFNSPNSTSRIDLPENIHSGVYFLRINDQQTEVSRKVIVLN